MEKGCSAGYDLGAPPWNPLRPRGGSLVKRVIIGDRVSREGCVNKRKTNLCLLSSSSTCSPTHLPRGGGGVRVTQKNEMLSKGGGSGVTLL